MTLEGKKFRKVISTLIPKANNVPVGTVVMVYREILDEVWVVDIKRNITYVIKKELIERAWEPCF